ncbi:MAG: hypothetical protein QOH79_3158 [Acidimicrobiaceae bacterium]
MGRRAFGSIRRLPSGRYQARLPDGETAPVTFTTKADAAHWLSSVETDLLRGTYAARPTDPDLTVGEWVDIWHREHPFTNALAPSPATSPPSAHTSSRRSVR